MWKNKLYSRFFSVILTAAGSLLAEIAVAAGTTAGGTTNTVSIPNPLTGVDTLPDLVTHISSAVIAIVLPIAVVAIIYAGFKLVIHSGNPTEMQKARKMLLYIFLGTVIIVGASILARAVVNFAKNL